MSYIARPPAPTSVEAKFPCPTCGAKMGQWCRPLNSGDNVAWRGCHRKRYVKFCVDQKRKFRRLETER